MFQDLHEISDGKIYTENDMVRVASRDCEGCHACCVGMGNSIVLDPLDVWRLCTVTGKTFEELLEREIELYAVEGLILPNLAMTGADERCAFLNEAGRCEIHASRPGLCRTFPLGRIYEEDTIRYFLQTGACKKSDRTKIKVSRWLDVPEPKKNRQFLLEWHSLRRRLEEALAAEESEETKKAVNMYLLRLFFVTPYHAQGDFYEEIGQRMAQAKKLVQGL